jgi:hypothetical protein
MTTVREAVHNPPEETRAYFRGQCVARYPEKSWPRIGIRSSLISVKDRYNGCRCSIH